MKTILILSISAILAHATFGADETTSILQPGKDYALAILESARVSLNGPVRVLSSPQNGWVRIEYTPMRATMRVEPGSPAEPPPRKRQVWLNLAHIVTIQDWDAAVEEMEQRKAARSKR